MMYIQYIQIISITISYYKYTIVSRYKQSEEKASIILRIEYIILIREMPLKTRFTELFNVEHPILCG